MITKKCPKCGDPMTYSETDTSVTCPTCHSTYTIRTKQADESPKPQEYTYDFSKPNLRCPRCGSEIVSRDSYYVCTHCASKIALDGTLISIVEQQQPQRTQNVDNSSFGLGFVLGFFFGLIGLIIGIADGRYNIKKGAIDGFFTSLILGLIAGFIIILLALGV